MSDGVVFDIKELGQYDGDGVRLTVFLKGCPLRCIWCHNPEGISPEIQLFKREKDCIRCNLCKTPCRHSECRDAGVCLYRCPKGLLSVVGKRYRPQELADEILSYGDFLKYGGVTFSGGEPTLQADFLSEVCDRLPHIHKAIETCACTDPDRFLHLCLRMDQIFVDLKLWDSDLHKTYTGRTNGQILANIRSLSVAHLPFTLRVPLIPGITDTIDNQKAIADFASTLGSLQRVELLGYNRFTPAKYRKFGLTCPISGELPEINPHPEFFSERGIDCRVYSSK
ncbi:MAG: glycyl-radical enzyme activating protein [Eubacteriales bacterium]